MKKQTLKMITFLRMPLRQKLMFFISFFLCGLARVTVKLLPYKRISSYFGQFCRMTVVCTLPTEEQIMLAVQISRSIKLAAQYTPWDSNCLTQAIVAKCWCQYYNIPYMFFIGFAKARQKPLGEEAHAWVTAGPLAITGGDSFNTHHVVLSYTSNSGMHGSAKTALSH